LSEPVIGGKHCRRRAPDEEECNQGVDDIDSNRAAFGDEDDAEDDRYRVKNELLWNEVAVELEELIWKRSDDDCEEAKLKEESRRPVLHRGNVLVTLIGDLLQRQKKRSETRVSVRKPDPGSTTAATYSCNRKVKSVVGPGSGL